MLVSDNFANCPDFDLDLTKPLGRLLIDYKIKSFHQALSFVKSLSYKRVSNLDDYTLVVAELCGTCSTKHAFLAALAHENGRHEIQVELAFFKFNATIMPHLASEFEKNQISYLPEGHCYLRTSLGKLDLTSNRFDMDKILTPDTVIETLILSPKQTGNYKQKLHEEYFQNWCKRENLPFEPIWQLRQKIIQHLVKISALAQNR